jgi:hypothetical protein
VEVCMREITRQGVIEDWIRTFSNSPISTKYREIKFDTLIKRFGLEQIGRIMDNYSTPERGNPGRFWRIKDPFEFVKATALKGWGKPGYKPGEKIKYTLYTIGKDKSPQWHSQWGNKKRKE